jgi:hypothetical protein
MDIQNTGAGSVTLTPVNSPIDQAASLILTVNQGVRLVSTGNGYLTQRGQGSGTEGVSNPMGALASGAIVTGDGGSNLMTPTPNATIDGSGNLSIPGSLTTNTSCSGCAGAIDLPAGTDPGAAESGNAASLIGPAAMTSSFRWRLPSADAAGAIVSDGAATPGNLSITPICVSTASNCLAKTGAGGKLDASLLPSTSSSSGGVFSDTNFDVWTPPWGTGSGNYVNGLGAAGQIKAWSLYIPVNGITEVTTIVTNSGTYCFALYNAAANSLIASAQVSSTGVNYYAGNWSSSISAGSYVFAMMSDSGGAQYISTDNSNIEVLLANADGHVRNFNSTTSTGTCSSTAANTVWPSSLTRDGSASLNFPAVEFLR